jgi:hypothetical protein
MLKVFKKYLKNIKMSFHIAVLVTSEKCGHCTRMRGEGILLTKKQIEEKKIPPNVPGGMHYDANFMKKLIVAGTDSAKLRIMNIHYKSFNPSEGVTNISVFTLEPDSKSIRQTMIKENNGKTTMDIYVIGDVGKKIQTQNLEIKWEDTLKTYIPVNLPNYSFFYPTLSIFHFESWLNAVQKNEPVFGYINGLPTREESPYGAVANAQPNVGDFVKFLSGFFDGTKQLLAKPVVKKEEAVPDSLVEHKPVPSNSILTAKEEVVEVKEVKEIKTFRIPTKGACEKLNVRLYVKE